MVGKYFDYCWRIRDLIGCSLEVEVDQDYCFPLDRAHSLRGDREVEWGGGIPGPTPFLRLRLYDNFRRARALECTPGGWQRLWILHKLLKTSMENSSEAVPSECPPYRAYKQSGQ